MNLYFPYYTCKSVWISSRYVYSWVSLNWFSSGDIEQWIYQNTFIFAFYYLSFRDGHRDGFKLSFPSFKLLYSLYLLQINGCAKKTNLLFTPTIILLLLVPCSLWKKHPFSPFIHWDSWVERFGYLSLDLWIYYLAAGWVSVSSCNHILPMSAAMVMHMIWDYSGGGLDINASAQRWQ